MGFLEIANILPLVTNLIKAISDLVESNKRLTESFEKVQASNAELLAAVKSDIQGEA